MSQTFLGAFLAFIGVIGLVVGLIQGHFTESPGQTLMYILPIVLGAIMFGIDQMNKRK